MSAVTSPAASRTTARLADGREIVYFDEPGSVAPAARVLDDPRQLPAKVSNTRVRYDPLRGEWVAMATHRQTRTYLPPADECPLCPSKDGRQTEIPSGDYDVVAFENRFPSFAGTGDPAATERTDPTGLFRERDGLGRCEVVCFTPDHDASFASLTQARARTVIDAWAERTLALGQRPDVAYVFCFENRGRDIGVTLPHPHGQIYGYPFVPPHARRMLDQARAYTGGTNLFADLLAAERADDSRVVTGGEHWTAFVPYAARWPVEVHLYPHRQVPDLPELTDPERDDLARVYLDVLDRLDRLYGEPEPLPYVAGVHQAPVRADRDVAYLHLRVHSVRRAPGKLKYLAGSESGMGTFVSDVLPEEVAARLRELA